MTDKARRRGSVILLVVGLLTILAMLGSTLLLISHLNRQTSQALASTAPMNHVAEAILAQLLENRAKDLHIDANVIYGGITGTLAQQERQTIDYDYSDPNDPNEFDYALASIEPNANAIPPTWRQITYLPGITVNIHGVPINTNDPNYVDADGDGNKDAALFATDIKDRDGNPFYAAVRMIDASGLLNINLANHTRDANSALIMGPVDLEPGVLPGDPNTALLNRTPPFDSSDWLALLMRGSPNGATGRLCSQMGSLSFVVAMNYLTIDSVSRVTMPPRPNHITAVPLRVKVNLDDANVSYDELRRAFLNMLNSAHPGDPNNLTQAAQLAVNIIDYRDADSNSSAYDVKDANDNNTGAIVYGIEREPIISEAFSYQEPNYGPYHSAIEIYNPYNTQTDNFGSTYKLKCGSSTFTSFPASLPPHARLVIRTDSSVFCDPNASSSNWPSLTLENASVSLVRQVGGADIYLDSVDITSSLPLPTQTDPNDPNFVSERWANLWRDDASTNARFWTDVKYDSNSSDPNNTYSCKDANTTNLGRPNPVGTYTGLPCPVYVRNGKLINVGEMLRIFRVGPASDSAQTLRQIIGPSNAISTGRLNPLASISPSAFPALPEGCLISDYFTVLTPDPNNNNRVHGLVNINTAPRSVLEALPGIAQATSRGFPPVGDPNAYADAIIAYRDRTGIWSNRPTQFGNLRNEYGFASAGEIMLPISVVDPNGPGTYSPSNRSPYNYYMPSATSNDGIDPPPNSDLVNQYAMYSWLSDQVTVRSDTYIAYIRVQADNNPASTSYRRYVAVIDRSNCTSSTDRPRVLLLAELK